jgi:RNA polymerase sigma factor (sigma-70 family)
MDDHCHHDASRNGASEPATADDQLLRQFLATRDEQAFRELVGRYSELVLGVCLRILRDRHDAEEAFQATFLVLARKAARVRGGRSLGPWLYGVAYRIAIRAHQRRARRKTETLPADVAMIEESLEGVWECHWRRALDDELNELPDKYRGPLVLHYLQGKTNNEVAAELGLSVRTVEGRQRRGKTLLKRRLALRKVTLPLAVSAVAATAVQAGASASLVDTTVAASVSFVTGNSEAGFENAARLAQNEVIAMSSSVAPVSVGLALLAALGAAVVGVGGLAVAESGLPQPLAVAVAAAAAAAEDGDASPFEAQRLKNDDILAVTVREEEDPLGERLGLNTFVSNQPTFDLAHQRSDAERRIFWRLAAATISLDFIDTPLDQVIQVISDEQEIQVVFDKMALDAVAISPDQPVTCTVSGVRLQSALRLLLRELELTYVVRDDVLLITTEDEAATMLETHIYDVSKILADAGVQIEDLAKIVPATVESDSWEVNGTGEGEIEPLGKRLLVINQTQFMHEKVADFLQQLRAVRPAERAAAK